MTQPFAVNSFSVLVRFCPICERHHGHKVRVMRKSVNDYAVCHGCGWLWHAGNCKCNSCMKRNEKKSEMSFNGKEI